MNVPVPVYGPVPPEAETVTVVVPPLHEIAGPATELAAKVVGSETVIDVYASHPLKSVIK